MSSTTTAAIPTASSLGREVVDVYDALTSDRAYRRALPHAAVIERLHDDAAQTLDGELVALFLELCRDGSADRAV